MISADDPRVETTVLSYDDDDDDELAMMTVITTTHPAFELPNVISGRSAFAARSRINVKDTPSIMGGGGGLISGRLTFGTTRAARSKLIDDEQMEKMRKLLLGVSIASSSSSRPKR